MLEEKEEFIVSYLLSYIDETIDRNYVTHGYHLNMRQSEALIFLSMYNKD